MSTPDQAAQEDELLALGSIYNDEEFKRAEIAQGGEIRIFPDVPENFRICVKGSVAANTENDNFEDTVCFLPPIVLNFELPCDYPSASAPLFFLSCKWLSPIQLSVLCRHLDALWEENQGSVVLFAWMQFLKEETLSFLNIVSPYELSVCTNGSLSWTYLSPKNTYSNSSSEELTRSSEVLDGRAIQDVDSLPSLLRHVLDFDQIQQKKSFDSKLYMCNICFCEKLGSECTHFKECHHVYCNTCLAGYFEVLIKDGQVHALNCPEPRCSSVANPAQVKELVDDQLFSRYDRLLLQSSLDLMADMVYCPRPSCETPVMQEPSGTMGICSRCRYAFCTLCKMTYHGVSPCKITAEKLIALRNEYLEANETTKRFMEQRYGKRVIQKAFEEMESKKWLDKNSKPCPRCGTHIQKIDGCNKMTCTGCSQYFCWLCMASLSRNNPYRHFTKPGSDCFNLLFQVVEVDGDILHAIDDI